MSEPSEALRRAMRDHEEFCDDECRQAHERRAKAVQDLADLTRELGLYDLYYDTDAAGELRAVRHELARERERDAQGQDPAAG